MTKKHWRAGILCSLAVLMFLTSACSSSLTQEQAQEAALDFVQNRGLFYTRGEGGSSDVGEVSLRVLSSVKQGSEQIVVVEASKELNGTVKQARLTVAVDLYSGEPRLVRSG